MSSGVSSEQSSGVGNVQLSTENFEYSKKLSLLQEEFGPNNLTDAQRASLDKIHNIVSQHLTELDYSGVKRDLLGDPVPNGRGGFFDHIQEMKDSYKGLKKAKRSLEKSLSNPNLGRDERIILEKALDTTNNHIHRIDMLFEPYGGIEKWKKE